MDKVLLNASAMAIALQGSSHAGRVLLDAAVHRIDHFMKTGNVYPATNVVSSKYILIHNCYHLIKASFFKPFVINIFKKPELLKHKWRK